MVLLIAKHRFLENIFNLRFTIAFVLCQILFVGSTLILTSDYVERLERYNASVQEHEDVLKTYNVFSELKVGLDRPPSPLSIISEGFDKNFGSSLEVAFNQAPIITEVGKTRNPLLVIFASLDLITIIEVVLSLLVIFLVYNVISGERETGTLKQVLANDVPRYQVLFGNLTGGMISIVFPLLVGLLASLLIMNVNSMIDLTLADYLNTSIIFCVAVLYLATFYLLGMFLSTRIRRSATVLTILLFIWIVSVIILPNVAVYVAQQFTTVPDKTVYDNQAQVLRDEWSDKMNEYSEGHPSPNIDLQNELSEQDYRFVNSIMGLRDSINNRWGFAYVYTNSPREIMEFFYEGTVYGMNLRMEYEDRIWELYQDYQSRLNKQASFARILSLCSPSQAFSLASSIIAGTDEKEYLNFISQASNYRNELIRYMKNVGGLDYLLFTRKPIDEYLTSRELITLKNARGDEAAREAVKYEVEPLDLSDMPRFTYLRDDLRNSILHAFPEILTLIFFNVIFFLLSWISFLKSDVQ